MLLLVAIFAPGETSARTQTRVWPPEVQSEKLASGFFGPEASILRQAAAMQAAKLQQENSSQDYDFASGCVLAAENVGGRFGGVVGQNAVERAFLDNAQATFGNGSVFTGATRHRGNIVIQRSDIPMSVSNLRRMQAGNAPFVKNAAGEWESLALHHVGRQDGKLIEILQSHNAYDSVTGGVLHIPGPGGPVRQSRLSQTYWQQRLEELIGSGQVPDAMLRQIGR